MNVYLRYTAAGASVGPIKAPEFAKPLVLRREAARERGDYEESDRIKKVLMDGGWKLRDWHGYKGVPITLLEYQETEKIPGDTGERVLGDWDTIFAKTYDGLVKLEWRKLNEH